MRVGSAPSVGRVSLWESKPDGGKGTPVPPLLTARGTNLPRVMRGRFLTVGNGVTNIGKGKSC